MKIHARELFINLFIVFSVMTAGQPKEKYDELTPSGKHMRTMRFEQKREKVRQSFAEGCGDGPLVPHCDSDIAQSVTTNFLFFLFSDSRVSRKCSVGRTGSSMTD